MCIYTKYRKDHPEWKEAEKIRNNEREKNKYNNDPDYKEKKKEEHWKDFIV